MRTPPPSGSKKSYPALRKASPTLRAAQFDRSAGRTSRSPGRLVPRMPPFDTTWLTCADTRYGCALEKPHPFLHPFDNGCWERSVGPRVQNRLRVNSPSQNPTPHPACMATNARGTRTASSRWPRRRPVTTEAAASAARYGLIIAIALRGRLAAIIAATPTKATSKGGAR